MRLRDMDDHREPTYDDTALYLHEDQEVAELVKALAEYAKTLEEMVVELRSQVGQETCTRTSRQPMDPGHMHTAIFLATEMMPGGLSMVKARISGVTLSIIYSMAVFI